VCWSLARERAVACAFFWVGGGASGQCFQSINVTGVHVSLAAKMCTPQFEMMLFVKWLCSVFVREIESVQECCSCSNLENLSVGVCVFGVSWMEMLGEIWGGSNVLDTTSTEVLREAARVPL
jgi:hypothetical protein